MEEREKKKALKPKKEKPLTTINVSYCYLLRGEGGGVVFIALPLCVDAMQCLWSKGTHEDKP